jgi:plastocyanin
MKRLFGGARVVFTSLLFWTFLQSTPVFGATVTVLMQQNQTFSPATVNINVGDTVQWTNSSASLSHDTQDDGFSIWNSGLLSPGQTFSRQFSSAGSFAYHCNPHLPGMRGTVNVSAAANNPPVVTPSGSALNYVEDQGARSIDPTISVSDSDSATLVSATISFASGFVTSEDSLSFVNQSGVSMTSYDGSTGTLVLGGTISPANYQIALQQVKYVNSSQNPNTAARTIRFVVNDGQANSSAVTVTVNVQSVNDTPVVNGSGSTLNYTEGSSAVTVDSTITVTDADNASLASATISIATNFVQGQDVLSFTSQPGITGSYDSNTGIISLSGSTNKATYQTLFQSVKYQNTSSNPNISTRTVRFIASDGAASNAGFNKNISITAVNNTPSVVGTGGTLSYTEGDAAALLDTTVTVGDVDSPSLLSATVTIKTNFQAGADVLTFVNQNGIIGTYTNATGVLGLSGSATLANYQTALQSVRFQNTSNNPSTLQRAVEFKVNDGQATSSAYFRFINVTATNDPPALSGSGGTLAYTEKDGAVVLDGSVSAADPDSANLASATVSIVSNFAPAEDSLVFANQSGITGSFNTNTGVLTLTNSASVASYQTALRSVRYQNSSLNPNTATRMTVFSANDGALGSGTYVRNISVTNVNDAPVVTFSSPANGATVDAPTTISVSATASDVDGTVAQVEFFEGQNSLGVQTGPGPYSLTMNNVNAGAYVITGRATDNLGLIGTTMVTNFVRGAVSNPTRLAGGEFRLDLSGLTTTRTNVIEVSTDLRTWTVLTNFLPSGAAVSFTDSAATGQTIRYYRHSVK